MRILVVNPNISESVTSLIREEAMLAALPGTDITTATAPFGVAYIETPAEAVIGAYAVLEMIAEHGAGHDAVVIAAFGDPGVAAAKEIFPVPVVDLSEAALAQALLLGGRFSIVGISTRIGAWYRSTVEGLGLASRFSSYRGLEAGFADVGDVQRDQRERLLDLCLACVNEDGSDSIVLAGAPLAGLARHIAGRVPVPLVDGVGSAIRMADALVRSGPVARKRGSLSPPPEKPHKGLAPALARYIGRAAA